MLESHLAPKLIFFFAFIASAVYVHFRGRVRHRFFRQLTDHSFFMAPYNALMYLFSAVPNRPYIDVARFPELAQLRDNWRMIRDEALALVDQGHIRAAAKFNDIGFNSFYRTGWKRFYLKWYDAPPPSARELCPGTVALVESIPCINGAMFAMLPAGAYLGAHRDPYAGSLRYHLGLVTPNSESCHLVVDGELYAWRDGEAVVFDETYMHHAENKSDMARIILFCDIERPLSNRVIAMMNRWFRNTMIRATQTENFEGDKVGLLNRVFAVAYRVRLQGKRVKARSRFAYYALKWVFFGGIFLGILFLP